jgi:hypothetical protein
VIENFNPNTEAGRQFLKVVKEVVVTTDKISDRPDNSKLSQKTLEILAKLDDFL